MPRAPEYQKERGERQKAKMIDLLGKEPMTAAQLSGSLHLTVSAVLLHTKAMMDCSPRRLHIAGWVPSEHGKPAPLYGLGDMPDAVYITKRKAKLDRLDPITYQLGRLIQFLEDEPRSVNELAPVMCLSPSRAREYVRIAKEMGWVRIKAWREPPARGDHTPVYEIGYRKDAPKPKQATRAERYKKEILSDEYRDKVNGRKRHKRLVECLRKSPQNIFSALGL